MQVRSAFNLTLAKSEPFGLVNCDFWQNDQGDVFMTIAQLAGALGYSDRSGVDKIIQRNEYLEEADFSVQDKLSGTDGKLYTTRLFTEDGIYEVAMLAKTPAARKFRGWVREVIKAIRKHGMYAKDELLDNPDLLLDVVSKLKAERDKRMAAETKALVLEQRVAEYEPKITYLDQILQSKDTVTITQIAKDYGMSGQKLNQILNEEGVQYKQNGQWLLYRKYHDKGYTKSYTVDVVHTNGQQTVKMNTRWTQKGRLFIHDVLTRRGFVAMIDRRDIGA
ncbi:phage antirepressor KilAC domain-containing protein [Brevibacillus parabrevis]|jgi:Uncharacterized phage-encoded protein|uniref:phage antirepressor KilAC domain-containing protein n=1 Tax=Brevibacillus parabrevis TaxID=54914 RepID=UPI0024928D63|nr:phage antirepressor KilAC domain-containing protein [Brevibacillus parabrevis]